MAAAIASSAQTYLAPPSGLPEAGSSPVVAQRRTGSSGGGHGRAWSEEEVHSSLNTSKWALTSNLAYRRIISSRLGSIRCPTSTSQPTFRRRSLPAGSTTTSFPLVPSAGDEPPLRLPIVRGTLATATATATAAPVPNPPPFSTSHLLHALLSQGHRPKAPKAISKAARPAPILHSIPFPSCQSPATPPSTVPAAYRPPPATPSGSSRTTTSSKSEAASTVSAWPASTTPTADLSGAPLLATMVRVPRRLSWKTCGFNSSSHTGPPFLPRLPGLPAVEAFPQRRPTVVRLPRRPRSLPPQWARRRPSSPRSQSCLRQTRSAPSTGRAAVYRIRRAYQLAAPSLSRRS